MINVVLEGRYEIESSDLVASGDNGLDVSDTFYGSEKLYRTKKGSYFIQDAAKNLVMVSDQGVIDNYVEYPLYYTIQEWVKLWDLSLKQRELSYFKFSGK